MWLGPVSSRGMDAPMYGCEACIAELDRMVRDHFAAKDTAIPWSPASPDSVPAGRRGSTPALGRAGRKRTIRRNTERTPL
ncbi:hypothetical protein JOC24_006693 [Streptomyces sp. HB132]|nr:hypothetical protein [Streptomyces sp. HB132]